MLLDPTAAEPVAVGDLLSVDAGGMPIYRVTKVAAGHVWVGGERDPAEREMPLEVYWLITVGSLVALHKLDEDAQAARALQGLDPKLRPVNKSALLLVLDSEAATSSTARNTVLAPSSACSAWPSRRRSSMPKDSPLLKAMVTMLSTRLPARICLRLSGGSVPT